MRAAPAGRNRRGNLSRYVTMPWTVGVKTWGRLMSQDHCEDDVDPGHHTSAPVDSPATGASAAALIRRANELMRRYESEDDADSLALAVETARQAVAVAGDRGEAPAVALNVLSNALTAAFQRQGTPSLMHQAVTLQREAVGLVVAGSNVHLQLSVNLAHRLIIYHDLVRDPAVLNEAVVVAQDVLARDLPPHWRAAALNNLGLACRARFEVTGDRADLVKSIQAQEESLVLTGTDDAESVNRLNNLGNARWALYLASGVLADLDLAVTAYQKAAESARSPLTRGGCLLGLGTAKWSRWGRQKHPRDLLDAVEAFTQAAALFDAESSSAAHCALNLGAALFARWRDRRDRCDLDSAIEHWTAVRENTRAAPEIATAATSNLGAALWERYEHSGAEQDLDDAITFLAVAPDDARVTLRPGRLFTLAGALVRRHELTGAASDARRAVEAYRNACVAGLTSNPGVALSAGQLWGQWAVRRGALVEADEAFTRATAAAHAVYRSQRSDEHVAVWLGQATELAASYAYTLARLTRVEDAVVTLERGRALLLSGALDSGGTGRIRLHARPC
jgi:hypothetical protein